MQEALNLVLSSLSGEHHIIGTIAIPAQRLRILGDPRLSVQAPDLP